MFENGFGFPVRTKRVSVMPLSILRHTNLTRNSRRLPLFPTTSSIVPPKRMKIDETNIVKRDDGRDIKTGQLTRHLEWAAVWELISMSNKALLTGIWLGRGIHVLH